MSDRFPVQVQHACLPALTMALLISMQITEMRESAKANVEKLLVDLNRRSSATKGSIATGSISTSMKAKLQNAVKAMQEGLVERDTEVSDACRASAERA